MNEKVFPDIQVISKLEMFILFFIRSKQCTEMETNPDGFYTMTYKMWRGKMFILSQTYTKYEKEKNKTKSGML